MIENPAPLATAPPNPVLGALGRVLERLLNHALTLDPDTRARIAKLDGRTVTIDFRNTPLAMRITVVGERLSIGPASGAPATLGIAATPARLIALALSARGTDTAFAPGSVEIAGDAELARRLEQIASRFRPDIDEAFARAFGDVIGFQLARALRRAFAWTRESATALARDGADFLSGESRDLVGKAELDAFLDEVDTLHQGVDRLHARVAQLAARSGTSSR